MRSNKDTVSRIASGRGPEPVAAVSATFATAEAASTHKAAGAGSAVSSPPRQGGSSRLAPGAGREAQ